MNRTNHPGFVLCPRCHAWNIDRSWNRERCPQCGYERYKDNDGTPYPRAHGGINLLRLMSAMSLIVGAGIAVAVYGTEGRPGDPTTFWGKTSEFGAIIVILIAFGVVGFWGAYKMMQQERRSYHDLKNAQQQQKQRNLQLLVQHQVQQQFAAAQSSRWAPDPYHRHQYRYYDVNLGWTEHVSDHGVTSIDHPN